MAPQAHGGQAPIWENVPFDVRCARCGQDLRGRTEPKCPACGLEFDWAEAVPIEQLTCRQCGYHLYGLRGIRCPECGEFFTWEEALVRYHRKRIALFEYQWRERPIRSFIGTWFRAMAPSLLWRKVTIHDPPRVGPLCVMAGLALLVCLLLGPVIEGSILWMESRINWRWVGPAPGLDQLPSRIMEQVRSPSQHLLMLLTVLWSAGSFASLMIFRQSMRHRRVRTIHVFRVWVYAVALALPVAFAGNVYRGPFLDIVADARRWGQWGQQHEAPCLIPLGAFVFVTWLICAGYSRYLRMDHSLGVALASQVIAWLAIPALADGLPRILGLK